MTNHKMAPNPIRKIILVTKRDLTGVERHLKNINVIERRYPDPECIQGVHWDGPLDWVLERESCGGHMGEEHRQTVCDS